MQVVRFFRSAHVSVMGLQEPHLSDEGDFDKIRKFFAARELAFTGSITGALRGGGAAIIYPIKWKLLKALSLTPRLLYVELLHPDGVPMGFFVGHLHHEAEQRKRQWELIKIHAPTLFLLNTVFLCNHNSVVMPSRDIAQPHLAPERGSVLDARDAETGTLSRLRLVDSYPCTHGCRDRPLEGWAWGFHGSLPPESATASQQAERAKKKPKKATYTPHLPDFDTRGCDRRRRIDRIHVPVEYEGYILANYATFLACSDHKAVLLTLPPPDAALHGA